MDARIFATWNRRWTTVPQGEEPILKHEFKGHSGTIWSFVFLHDNVHIVSGSMDGTMRKWNCDTGLVVGEPWKGEGGWIYALALSPDGKTIACGREDGSVQQWTTDGEMMKGVWTGHSGTVRSLGYPMEVELPAGPVTERFSFEGQKMEQSRWARSTRGHGMCGVLRSHLQVRESPQAVINQSVSGTPRPATLSSAQLKTWGTS